MSGAAGERRFTDPMIAEQNPEGRPGLVQAALFGLCPDCGAKTLFAGPVRFAESCDGCGLDYSTFNVGDGPAALLTMAIGALVIIAAFGLELLEHPPFWVHAIIWVPMAALLVIGSLRFAKGALLVAEHRNQAKEGRLER